MRPIQDCRSLRPGTPASTPPTPSLEHPWHPLTPLVFSLTFSQSTPLPRSTHRRKSLSFLLLLTSHGERPLLSSPMSTPVLTDACPASSRVSSPLHRCSTSHQSQRQSRCLSPPSCSRRPCSRSLLQASSRVLERISSHLVHPIS